jgi:hypothetical protein
MPLTKVTQNLIEGIVSTGSTGISAGSFIVGQQYKITSLGTTTQSQWNTIAGTTGQTYVVGSLFTAATIGASSGNGEAAVARTLANRFADVVNVKDFGAVGDGVADDTAFIQTAINAAQGQNGKYELFIPAGTYRCTSQLTISREINIRGTGASPYTTGTLPSRGNGSWFHFDHTGIGMQVAPNVGAAISGIQLRNFGTLRNQPTPTAGWTPNTHQYDISISASDVLLEDLMILNATKGISLFSAGYGKLQINRVRGQAFQNFLYIAESFDTSHVNDIHVWPFWSGDSNVLNYQFQNFDAIFFKRSDNNIVNNLFVYGASNGIRMGDSASGSTYRGLYSNIGLDFVTTGILIDSTSTGNQSTFNNIYTFASDPNGVGCNGILISGNNSKLTINNAEFVNNESSLKITGSNNNVIFGSNIFCNFWDALLNNTPAINYGGSNTVSFGAIPKFGFRPLSSGVKYPTNVYPSVNDWRDYTPTVRSISGTITSYTATAKYKFYENTLIVVGDIALIDNGTGATQIGVSLPSLLSKSATTFSAHGSGLNPNNGTMLSAYMGPGLSSEILIRKYDATYPATTGQSVRFTILIQL